MPYRNITARDRFAYRVKVTHKRLFLKVLNVFFSKATVLRGEWKIYAINLVLISYCITDD